MGSPSTETPITTAATTTTLYFAYGSNLSLTQMARRCPASRYHATALLRNYKWVIGPRGYANVVSVSVSASASEDGDDDDHVVYGLLYTLPPRDERALDVAEGVPDCYVKRMLDVEVLPGTGTGAGGGGGTPGGVEVVKALVYVDEARAGEGVCMEEYVGRMNRGIRDAVKRGVPREYVDGVLRRWIRDEPVEDELEDPFFPVVSS